MKLLFLCTGNYYRSRFAEAVFCHLDRDEGIFRVSSRGLWRSDSGNVGCLSPHTREGLALRGIAYAESERMPLRATVDDLTGADLVVAVDRREHQPMLRDRFPPWRGDIVYFDVPDVRDLAPTLALPRLEEATRDLHRRLLDRME